ncbi:hypothetical protein AB0K48_47570 [Nonomuraea sp. NPDC055795]
MAWIRLPAVVAAVMLAASALTTGTAQAAPAALGLLQCQGTESVSYSPSIILTPRDITITTSGQFTSCADGEGQVTSGSYGETFTIAAGCNSLLDSFQAERVVAWSTGDSSTLTVSGSTTAVLGQVVTTITGTVTAGRFQGRTVLQTITLPQTQLLQCLTTGLTGTTGLTTLTLA